MSSFASFACARSTLSANRLTGAGRFAEAFELGLAALAGEPLRESAHRALVRVHLAEGNVGEAVRQYELCRSLLREKLGVEPSEQMDGRHSRTCDGTETVS